MEVTIVQQEKPKAPVPATPPPPAPAPQLKVPTAEELKEKMVDTYAAMGWGTPPAKPAAAAPEAPPAPAAPAEAPEVEPEPEPQPQPSNEPTTAQIITRAARETAREVATALRPQMQQPAAQPALAAEPQKDLSPEDQQDLVVIQFLEHSNPGKYSGITAKYLAFVRRNYDYIEKWQKEHTDVEFNPDDSEHKNWYDNQNPAPITAGEVEDGKLDMRVEARLQPDRDAREREKILRTEVPKIHQTVLNSIGSLVKNVSPELHKIINRGGAITLSDENLAKVDAADPIAKEVLDAVSEEDLIPFIEQLELTSIPNLGHRLSDNNPVHNEIRQFVEQIEKDISGGPPEARDLDGKQWMPLRQYDKRIKQINAMPESERDAAFNDLFESHWIVTNDMVRELRIEFCAKKAQGLIEKRDGTARRKYGTTAPAVAPAAPTARPTPQPASNPANVFSGRRQAPPSGGGGDLVTTALPGNKVQKSFSETAIEEAFPR